MPEFKLPYPTKVWGMDTIANYVKENNIPLVMENYTEENKETLCLDIKEYISKVTKEEKENPSTGDSDSNNESKAVDSEEVEDLVKIMPLYTQKYVIGGVEYSLRANVPTFVPRQVARMLNNARVLSYII